MKRTRYGRIAAIVTAGALALTACGNDPVADSGSNSSGGGDTATESDLSGKLAGSGATSQQSAQEVWIAKFGEQNPDVDLSYDPVGSGGGRKAFLDGGAAFAGSDSALKDEERTSAKTRCAGGEAYELPLYISPIAVVYNLPNVKDLQLTPSNVAKIFDGKITKWNDPALVADNPNAQLPDSNITPINRSDESGTTANFTDYLAKTAKADWPYPSSGNWPKQGTQSAQGTSGVVQAVQGGEGTIAYADHSQAGKLGVAKIKVGDKFVEPTADGAAKVVEESPQVSGLAEHDLALDLKRDTTTAGAYPLLLVSYIVVCSKYEDAEQGKLVKAYVGYIASEDGQKAAADEAGSAPISDSLRTKVESALDAIK
ncbi:phosphate ABC transporter substrate-binding protein PstS [Actinophytocola sp.]|uniref:phosphate ABC transporter substrate-binding protein PstS n=1 Tax=Actinophytocola sp. TaxID=1872138 RepID=UPI00389A04BC